MVQHAHPTTPVEVWTMDEHRIGLKPILRKVWCRRGQRPVVTVQPRYQWLYVYGFVRPTTGETYWLLLPTVSSAAFNVALREFAAGIGAGLDKQVILVLDGAGWHRSGQVTLPVGVQTCRLPPYSPELQPAERLWRLSNEAIVNRHFATLDELQTVQAERCRQVRQMPAVVKAHTHFHWWPSDG